MIAARVPRVALGGKLSGSQFWRLLWASSRPLSAAVLAWAALDTFDGPLVIAALGYVVGAIPAAIAGGYLAVAPSAQRALSRWPPALIGTSLWATATAPFCRYGPPRHLPVETHPRRQWPKLPE